MLTRQNLLRAMIACLAATALSGIAGAFVGAWDTIGRLCGTGIAGAIASLMMLRATIAMEKPETFRGGCFRLWLAVALFVLALPALWSSILRDIFGLSGQFEAKIWVNLLAFALTGAAAGRFIDYLQRPNTRLAAQVALAADAAVLLLLLPGIWTDHQTYGDSFLDRLMQVAGVLVPHGLLAAACLVGWQRGDKAWWRWIGVAAATLAFLLFSYGILMSLNGKPDVPATALLVAVFLAHLNLMSLVPLKGQQSYLRTATVATTGITLALVDCLIVTESRGDGLIPRLAIATGIPAACGTLTLLVLAKLNRSRHDAVDLNIERDTEPAPDAAKLPAALAAACPVCAKALTLPAGNSVCDGCGLLFTLAFALPRCAACGYSLLHHHGPTCPECGATLRANAS